MPNFKLWGRADRVKYDSATTRHASLDAFAGGAMIDEPFPGLTSLSIDSGENLMEKHQSRTCVNDLPSRWGVKVVTKKLAGRYFEVDNDIDNFMRNKGEPIK